MSDAISNDSPPPARRSATTEALRDSEARLEALVDQSPVSVQVVAPDGRTTRVNRAFEAMWGLRLADLAEYNVWSDPQLVANGFRPFLERAFGGESLTLPPVRFDADRSVGKGRARIVEATLYPVRDREGQVMEVVILHQDITRRAEAEAALREREERLRAALAASGTGTFRWDIRTDAIDLDESLERLLGMEPGGAARTLGDVAGRLHPDDRDELVARCRRSASEGGDFAMTFRVAPSDGPVRWLSGRGRTFAGRDGRPAYMTGACVDITDRVSAEAAVQLSEARFRSLVGATTAIAWTTDPQGAIVEENPRWEAFTGQRPEEYLGWGWLDAIHPDDRERTGEAWRAALEARSLYECEYRIRRRDGEYRLTMARGLPLLEADGTVREWVGANTDVTDERAARARVERLQGLTAALAGTRTVDDVAEVVVAAARAATNARTAMMAVRIEGTYEAAIIRQTGLTDAVMARYTRFRLDAPGPAARCLRTGEPVFAGSKDDLLALFPEIADVWSSLGAAALATVPLTVGDEVLGAMSFTFGEPRTMSRADREFYLTLARQAAQAVQRARLLEGERRARDDAEAARRRAEEARERADEANRAKAQFLANMSHELRTPLNAIGGYVELLELELRGPVTDAQRADLARIRRSQQHLLGLINDVLNFAKLEAGHAHFDIADVPLAPVLEDMALLVNPQLVAKGLRYDPGECGADVVVRADREKLQQILLNLLTNAVKFTDAPGTIAVRCDADEREVRIHVSDTGIGIPPDEVERIFDPFVQVDPRLTRSKEGTGLGLAISRDLALGMAGSLTVESTVGEGSTFTLALPRGGAA